MDTPDTARTANLIVVSEEPEAAAALTSRLRGQKLGVGVEHLASPEDLDTHPIQSEDIVVWDARSPWALREIAARLAARHLDPPLLALLPALEPARLAPLAEEGARDVIALDAPEHLGAIVRRELKVAGARSERRRLNETCLELRTNWETTLHALPFPVALLQDGTHVFVNDAYRAFFHKEDLDDTPFLGLFPKSEHETLKKALRAAVRAGGNQAALEISVAHPDDPKGGVVRLLLWPEMREGVPVVLAFFQPLAAPPPPSEPAREEKSEAAQVANTSAGVPALETPARFVARIEEYLRSSPPKKTDQALLMVGVDDYVRLVDNYGPLVGESVLKQVEQRLVRELLPLEFATRLGRDHYLWLQRPRGEGVELFAQGLVGHLNSHVYESGEYSLTIVTRAGWADRHQCRGVWDLVRAAHNAYLRGGQEPVSRHIPSVAGIENAEQTAAIFRRLLEEHRLGLSVTTLQAVRTGPSSKPVIVDSAPDEPLNQLARADLFKIVKRAGLLRAHDRWLVAQALARGAALLARGSASLLAVRVSGETLDDQEFLPWFEKQAGEAVRGKLLFLVSERSAAGRLRGLQAFAQAAHPLGITIGLSEFGSGPQAAGLLRYIRPTLVILDPQLGSQFAELAALAPQKRATAGPLGVLLETCRAENIPLAMAGQTIEELKLAHDLGMSYVLGSTPELLPPSG